MHQAVLENGTKAWEFGSAKYVKTYVGNVEEYLSKKGETFTAQDPTTLSNTYLTDIDISEEIVPHEALY